MNCRGVVITLFFSQIFTQNNFYPCTEKYCDILISITVLQGGDDVHDLVAQLGSELDPKRDIKIKMLYLTGIHW